MDKKCPGLRTGAFLRLKGKIKRTAADAAAPKKKLKDGRFYTAN